VVCIRDRRVNGARAVVEVDGAGPVADWISGAASACGPGCGAGCGDGAGPLCCDDCDDEPCNHGGSWGKSGLSQAESDSDTNSIRAKGHEAAAQIFRNIPEPFIRRQSRVIVANRRRARA
jgi:hypothetical protein